MKRTAIFGDLSGHLAPFILALDSLGVRFDPLYIPEDLTIIQVGDLIHKGEDSNEIIALVDDVFKSPYRSQWIQLAGNHELNHLPFGQKFWRCDCHPEAISLIQDWWERREMVMAAGLRGGRNKYLVPNMETLITHAGLTFPFFSRHLKAANVQEAVTSLWNEQKMNTSWLATAGIMMSGAPSPFAGPFWALSVGEVYETWIGNYAGIENRIARIDRLGMPLYTENMPFNQIHGHSYPFNWERSEWYATVPKFFRKEMNAYQKSRVSRFRPDLASGAFLGIDPGFENTTPTVEKQPFLLVEDVEEIFVQ